MKSLLLLGAFGLVGCVGNPSTLTIEHYVLDDPMANCVVTPTSTFIQTSGLLDVGIVASTGSPGYTVFPVVQNHLAANLNVTTDVERHGITVKGVNVELQPDSSVAGSIPDSQRKFFVAAGVGRLEPQGMAAFGVEVLPRPVALSLAKSLQVGVGTQLPTVTARVSPVGDYGGDTVVGPPVDFPIQVCNFCLSGKPAACPAAGFPKADVKTGSCFVAQDENVTCCVDSTNQLLCGSAVPQQAM